VKELLKRSLIYETLVFFYAVAVAWIIIGNPWKSIGLSVIITVTKYPFYYLFHHAWGKQHE